MAVFIEFSFKSISLFSYFFKLIIAEGTTGGFNESGIDGNAFIDGQALAFELSQDFRVELVHGLF